MEFRPNIKLSYVPYNPSTSPNTYHATTVIHPDLTDVDPGDEDVIILRVGIETQGSLNPLSLLSMKFGAKGTDDNHVSAAKLYYTGTSTILDFTTAQPLQTLAAPINDE